jgi:hypothetical protein
VLACFHLRHRRRRASRGASRPATRRGTGRPHSSIAAFLKKSNLQKQKTRLKNKEETAEKEVKVSKNGSLSFPLLLGTRSQGRFTGPSTVQVAWRAVRRSYPGSMFDGGALEAELVVVGEETAGPFHLQFLLSVNSQARSCSSVHCSQGSGTGGSSHG